jgi:flagellar basal body P-ring formation protein FlgA
MIRFALAALACLALAPLATAQAAGSATTVKGEWIALGDVVPVTGDAAFILLGPSPPPGQTLALDPVFIASVAKKSGVIVAIPLDKPIWVTRATGNAPPAKVANPARQANAAPQVASEAEPVQILVLARDIARGQRISDGDLEWADAASNRTTRNGATDIDLAIGMETKRALKAGQPMLTTDLKQASLIKKGQPVKLIYASPGLRLTVEGLAQSDAGKGESVRVLNSYSKRTVEAVAIADGEAHVSRR